MSDIKDNKEVKLLTKAERDAKIRELEGKAKHSIMLREQQSADYFFEKWANCSWYDEKMSPEYVLGCVERERIFTHNYHFLTAEWIAEFKRKAVALGYNESEINFVSYESTTVEEEKVSRGRKKKA